MRLGFDIDEVVIDLIRPFTRYLNEKYNLSVDSDLFEDYELEKAKFVEDLELNEVIIKDALKTINDPDFQTTAEPFPDAVKYLRLFKKNGHKIHFISSRPFGKEESTAITFRQHGIPFDSIHHLGHYRDKGTLGRDLLLDTYIDDRGSALDSMTKYKSKWRALGILDKPWNSTYYNSKVNRIYTWDEIYRLITIPLK